MNNYSKIQKFLHRAVLTYKLPREIMFDIEQLIFLKKDDKFDDEHVFVAGFARSGTTVLLNAIYQSNEFASLTYDDMPFILAPNFWKKISPIKKQSVFIDREHNDNLKISTKSPEAFEEVFWKTFSSDKKNSKKLFGKFISLILKKYRKTRYLSKNNQNIRRLILISEFFPKSKILIPFRDPLQQSFSLYSQHMKFIKKHNEDDFVRDYMKLIGHSEFGLDYRRINEANLMYPDDQDPNHWLEQWYLTYNNIIDLSRKHKNIQLIGYESLCHNPKVWISIKEMLRINQENDFLFKESKKIIVNFFDNNLSSKCSTLYDSLNYMASKNL